ncbi:MAG TPA: class I SAM-dependent methyltransferase [Gemmataceae bacterium]|jgi:SAM-dependent methyltransferase|nr:class I SAM-dependent methyltransferase [Gemmataceae bacterium]
MNQFLRGVVRAVVESFDLPGPVLEIGSYQVAGQEHAINLRSLFPGKEFIGVDFREGPGVDCVADVETLPQASGSVGTVIAVSTFEHVRHFWRGFDEVYRVLRPDGVLVVACPFYFHVHGYPSDYWRFTPQALELLLDRYPNRILGWHGAVRRPANVWGVAFREKCEPPTVGQYEKYRRLLKEYAREPLPWRRKLVYQLGRLICGRRPFAPHLDRERWQTEFRAAA